MTNIFVQKWRVCGESELYDSKSEAAKGRAPGTILESVVVLEEVVEPEGTINAESENTEPNEGEGENNE